MTENSPKPRPRWLVIAWLIISQLIAAVSLLFWLAAAGMSVMAFDSGVSREATAFVIAIWSYPILPLGLAIAAWIAYHRQKDILALVLSTLTFIPPILLFMYLYFRG